MNFRTPRIEELNKSFISNNDTRAQSTRKRHGEKGNKKRYQEEKAVKRKPLNSDSDNNTQKRKSPRRRNPSPKDKRDVTAGINFRLRTSSPFKGKGKNPKKVEQHPKKIEPSGSELCKLETNIR